MMDVVDLADKESDYVISESVFISILRGVRLLVKSDLQLAKQHPVSKHFNTKNASL